MKTNDAAFPSKYMIDPNNILKLIFDIIGFTLIVYQSILLPFEIAFNFQDVHLNKFDYFIDAYFILDLLLNFNSGIYLEGILIMKRKEVCEIYLKTWFIFDLISSFPYTTVYETFISPEVVHHSSNKAPELVRIIRLIRFVKILRILKMFKFRTIFYKFEDFINSDYVRCIYIYIKSMASFIFVWHYLSCIMFAVANSQFESHDDSLGKKFQLHTMSIAEQYKFIFYFILTTFFTIGYGDIKPTTNAERTLAIFLMILSHGLFCYLVSTIHNVIQKMIDNRENLDTKLRGVKKFFHDKNLPKNLYNKVSNYLEFIYIEKESRRMDDIEVFSILNDKLSHELRVELNKRILLNFKMFKSIKFEIIIDNLCEKVYEEILNPYEILITECDFVSKRMYFIDKGNVIIYHESSSVVLKELRNGNYFGEFGFFTFAPNKQPRTASAVTKNFCSIFFILQNEFLEILRSSENKNLRDEILSLFEIKDNDKNILMEKLGIVCYFCNGPHFIRDCPSFNKSNRLVFLGKFFI
jgi:hypothetical protein